MLLALLWVNIHNVHTHTGRHSWRVYFPFLFGFGEVWTKQGTEGRQNIVTRLWAAKEQKGICSTRSIQRIQGFFFSEQMNERRNWRRSCVIYMDTLSVCIEKRALCVAKGRTETQLAHMYELSMHGILQKSIKSTFNWQIYISSRFRMIIMITDEFNWGIYIDVAGEIWANFGWAQAHYFSPELMGIHSGEATRFKWSTS